MSNYAETSGRSRRDASCSDKPRHVRRLHFAPLILELDTVEQSSTFNRGLIVDQNVAHIPCTSKSDYVRKWIETHENRGCHPSDESSQSSPVLRRSAIKTGVETSPVIGSNRKRRRGKTRINRRAAMKSVDNTDCQENVEHSDCELDCENRAKSENEQARPSEIHCTSPCTEQAIANASSPVLGTYKFSRKRKRKKSLHVLEDVTSSKRLKFFDKANVNVNPIIESDNDLDLSLREVPADCERMEEDSDTNVEAGLFFIERKKNPEKFKVTFSSPERLQDRLSFRDSSSNNTSKDKDDPKIEVGTSDDEEVDSKDAKYETSTQNFTQNDSDNNLSNIIEDIDTQEVVPSQPSVSNIRSCVPSRQLFTPSRLAVENSNETYCSEAEMMQAQSIMHLSAKISQITSLKEITQRTGQSDAIISSITTPSKKSPNKTMHACLLDSGKKRHKPKKGSMLAKLHTLVNAQISGIRIWHHHMHKDSHNAEFISVLVRDCTEQFGNQFLDGFLIEDRFNLLRGDMDVDVEEAESRDAQGSTQFSKTQPFKEIPRKRITVMLVCDIVGTLKMTSKVVINVYPPWNILDKDDLTLEANYISINDNCKIPDIPNVDKPRERKRRLIKEFNCLCIEEQRELTFCARKPTGEKPDVMERIFDF